MNKVLIVDDEADIVGLMERALKAESFEVICAYDGIGALDIAEVDKPDIVLLDIMMPMMSGYEVAEQLKSNPQTRDIPILLVTSAFSPDTRERAQRCGAQGLLVKPFIPRELVAQVKRHIEHARQRAQTRDVE